MAIDPVTGAKRFLSGDSSRVSDKPEDMVPSRLGGTAMAGALWRGSNTGAFESDPDPFLELDLLYGDPTTGRSRTPYDAFGVVLRFGGGGAVTRRLGIVALARRVLIALWRYSETGVVPDGARLKA